MKFDVANDDDHTVGTVDLVVFDAELYGERNSETSRYTLVGPFAPRTHVAVERDDVPEPPHWTPNHFSSLSCALARRR